LKSKSIISDQIPRVNVGGKETPFNIPRKKTSEKRRDCVMALNITPSLEVVSQMLPLFLTILIAALGLAYLKKLY